MWIQNEANDDWHYKVGVVTVATLVKGTGGDPEWVILDNQDNLTELFYGHDIGYLPGFKSLQEAQSYVQTVFGEWMSAYIAGFAPHGWQLTGISFAPTVILKTMV